MRRNSTPLAERFAARVAQSDGCWPCAGPPDADGYKYIYDGSTRRRRRAHRVAWEIASGTPVPDGMGVYHVCDNPPCVRNDDEGTYEVTGRIFPRWGHLWLGTTADNVADKIAKGRAPSGERNGAHTKPHSIRKGVDNGRSRLTPSQVLEIRALHRSGMLHPAIAERFGVSTTCVWDIVNGRSWKHL